jgi:hypothetical protein
MTTVKCDAWHCTFNEDEECTAIEITLEQEPYHAPECCIMRAKGKKERRSK